MNVTTIMFIINLYTYTNNMGFINIHFFYLILLKNENNLIMKRQTSKLTAQLIKLLF